MIVCLTISSLTTFVIFPTTCSSKFSNLSAVQRNILLCVSSYSNFRIVVEAKIEERFEIYNRIWRRWTSFCNNFLGTEDPILMGVPTDEVDFAYWSCIEIYRKSDFIVLGHITQPCKKPMTGKTVKVAVSSLGSSLWKNFNQCPFHHQDSQKSGYTIIISNLLDGISRILPSCKSQKTITPDLL